MSRPNGVGEASQNPEPNPLSFIFDWRENGLEEDLRQLWVKDLVAPKGIMRVLEEMRDSHLYGQLCMRYEEALADHQDDIGKQHQILDVLLARMYIAGSLRGHPVIDL